jgi:hypothetical protein
MKRINFVWLAGILLVLTMTVPVSGQDAAIIGETENTYKLAAGNDELRGFAIDEVSKDGPILYVLDRSGKLFLYSLGNKSDQGENELAFLRTIDLPLRPNGKPIESPRGLAFSLENRQQILYFLNWTDSGEEFRSELWRLNLTENNSNALDLSFISYKVGNRETLDLTYENGNILVSFDASGYLDNDLRVRRGIVQLAWSQAYDGKLDFIRHLPDSGTSPSRGLAFMRLEGARYFWGTVGDEFIYAADAPSGRGLFHFAIPKSSEESETYWGLAFGDDSLWVAEGVSGPDLLHRVNVTRNLNAPYVGPRILRHLSMTIRTEPEGDAAEPGAVYHYYSRPYDNDVLGNMGVWPETEKFSDASDAPNAVAKTFTYDPGEDTSSRQYMAMVEYANAPARTYASEYEVDIWTNLYRRFVYPHRVDLNRAGLAGTDYLADDPELFNLTDTATYDDFIRRIEEHIEDRYGIPANMKNPYWAVRNALEYIQDHYYYPSRPKRKPAAVDYDLGHYDANPGNLKIDLSRNEYDKSQIIACSGTSVMLAGYMRYLGFPARWLGTGNERPPQEWDANGNSLLDADEKAPVSSGHRYTQVWLGSHYGWICFDGTPTRPPYDDFDPEPPLQPQWRFMNRAAAGHLKDKRIVFNVGSGLFRPLYREFEYDEKLAINNDCGGDQRYNLQGRFEKPPLWKLARHRIFVENVCFIPSVGVSGPKNDTRISWALEGYWDKDSGAKLSVCLQKLDPGTQKPEKMSVLAKNVSPDAGHTSVDLSGFEGGSYRILIHKVGDNETGGYSGVFNLN